MVTLGKWGCSVPFFGGGKLSLGEGPPSAHGWEVKELEPILALTPQPRSRPEQRPGCWASGGCGRPGAGWQAAARPHAPTRVSQDGDFSFPLESVKKLKALGELQERSMRSGRKRGGPALPGACSHLQFPEELRPLCKEPNAPEILGRLGEPGRGAGRSSLIGRPEGGAL